MSLRHVYRESRFLSTEPGSYLEPWNRPIGWEPPGLGPLGSSRLFERPWYRVQGSADTFIAYLDLLIHRYPYRPYLFRRVSMPCGLMLALIQKLLNHQERSFGDLEGVPPEEVEKHLSAQAAHFAALEQWIRRDSFRMPMMRVFRLLSTLIKQRGRFLADVEAFKGEDMGLHRPMKMQVTPLRYIEPARYFPANKLRKAFERQVAFEDRIRTALEAAAVK